MQSKSGIEITLRTTPLADIVLKLTSICMGDHLTIPNEGDDACI
jgi:hypothetical protein